MRIEIAPRFFCDNWNALKPKLDVNGGWASSPENWDRAIEIARSRIQKRFLDSAAQLDGLPYAGFAILALDCLLIETIQAFRNGRHTKNSLESRRAVPKAFLVALLNAYAEWVRRVPTLKAKKRGCDVDVSKGGLSSSCKS